MLVTIPPNQVTTVHKKAEGYEVMMSKKLLGQELQRNVK